jgi:hypothetical protein
VAEEGSATSRTFGVLRSRSDSKAGACLKSGLRSSVKLRCLPTCRQRCRRVGALSFPMSESWLRFKYLLLVRFGRQDAPLLSMAKETREPQADYTYARYLLSERRTELAALRLRDPRTYSSPSEHSSCIRALEGSIIELERLLQNDSRERTPAHSMRNKS